MEFVYKREKEYPNRHSLPLFKEHKSISIVKILLAFKDLAADRVDLVIVFVSVFSEIKMENQRKNLVMVTGIPTEITQSDSFFKAIILSLTKLFFPMWSLPLLFPVYPPTKEKSALSPCLKR